MGMTNLNALILDTGPVLPGSYLYTGNWWFVNETTGSDGNDGSAATPFKTLSQALTKASANNNDVVAFIGTIHLTSTLVWSKNQVHLVGMCDPLRRGKRARISSSGSTAFTPLVSVTASGCHMTNFGTFYGFNSASNNATCWSDTGGRNCYDRVEFMGFGDGTATTGTANKTGSRAFVLNTSTGETTWRDCVFGVDTIQRNATNYTVELAGGAPRLSFENCDFESDLGSSGTGSSHILIGSAGIDRYAIFNRCRFLSDTKSSGSAMAQAFNVSGSAGGLVLLDQCTMGVGVTKIETSASGSICINMGAPNSTLGGLAIANN